MYDGTADIFVKILIEYVKVQKCVPGWIIDPKKLQKICRSRENQLRQRYPVPAERRFLLLMCRSQKVKNDFYRVEGLYGNFHEEGVPVGH